MSYKLNVFHKMYSYDVVLEQCCSFREIVLEMHITSHLSGGNVTDPGLISAMSISILTITWLNVIEDQIMKLTGKYRAWFNRSRIFGWMLMSDPNFFKNSDNNLQYSLDVQPENKRKKH